MPTGDVIVELKAVSRRYSVVDEFEFRFLPRNGSAGGSAMTAKAALSGLRPQCRITSLPCLGAGTDYELRILSRRYDVESVSLRVCADEETTVLQELMVNPASVIGIQKPAYAELPTSLRLTLEEARIDGREARGESLYPLLTDMECACLMNVHARASAVWQWVRCLRCLEQDRVFVLMDDGVRSHFGDGKMPDGFSCAPAMPLHDAVPGFRIVDSFRTNDAHANLHVTFLHNDATGEWAADLDIDEASGFRHAIEVLRNGFPGRKTNPYEIHQLLTRHCMSVELPYALVFRS